MLLLGKAAAEVIYNLYTKYNINLSNVHVIGHSLGGHVSGFIGKAFKTRTNLSIGRITALDPSGPLICPTDPETRLNGTDADIVVTIHTDGMVFGYFWVIGGIDFYPNGGKRPQPGCISRHKGKFLETY